MPSAVGSSKKGRVIKSAYESDTFDADVTIHVDGLVGSATISPAGRDIALASPEGLAIIDLDSPFSPPRRLSSHGLPWLVVDVQWSPFAARDYWVASTANHRCLIWNVNMRDDSPNGAIEHSLQGHSRAITDINFSAHHPDMLSTCAVDGYVHIWDLRRPRQPALTFCDWFAGATQVKYNRQAPHVLASAHDRMLHVWDDRKASKPLKSINAHTSKIYGLDWNRTQATRIATCSLDKTIKMWDYSIPEEPERIIRTNFPVWRARHTPFGWGLLAMPQNDPGNLYLYDARINESEPREEMISPIATFSGHGNYKVREFLWRARGTVTDEGVDKRDFQLVSWGEDNEVRLQRADAQILRRVGHVKDGLAPRNLQVTRKGAAYRTWRSIDDNPSRERRSATMSDPRPGSGGTPYRRSTLTMGMQGMAQHYARSGLVPAWKGPSMKAKPNGNRSHDKSMDQLGWMKGITMSKKKRNLTANLAQRKDSRDSALFGSNYNDTAWGEPDTLHDEILRVSHKVPNVHWENVDMNNLMLDASLRGPWGSEGENIYMRVKIDIPDNYPKSSAPKFIIEKTAMMSEEMFQRLDQEVNQIVAQFARRKQNCLEPALSYLLGETDLLNSSNFFKNVRNFDDDIDGLADESSSEDEENDYPTGGSTSMSQELAASTDLDATLAPANRPVIPPLPRFCGARWSNDGRLVCFFPSREEKARALFATPTEGYRERVKGEPSFAGFGRLQPDSPPPRQRHLLEENSNADDRSESEESEETSSSSDSESAYMHKVHFWYLPKRRFKDTFSGTYSVRSSGGGTGIETGTGTVASRRRLARPRNIVSLHNLADLLPSKRELALEYRIFGDGPEVCGHNAQVADKYGRTDLVHIWKYAALLLKRDIPLELLNHGQRRDSVLVVARDAVARFKDSVDDRSNEAAIRLTGRVKWGLHPLAKDFIYDLFGYFEQAADVQMLAMFSCIFSEVTSDECGIAYAESHLTQPETPLTLKAPSFSLDYFPADASLWNTRLNAKSQVNSVVSTPKTIHTPLPIPGSLESDLGIWPGEPGSNSYSCGETSPSRTPREGTSDTGATQSLSTSPDPRPFRRVNSTLMAGFAGHFPRTSGSSTSPPTQKRTSPGEAILANFTPSNITWGASTVLGPTSDPATTRNSYSDDEQKREDTMPFIVSGITVTMEDQSIFDDDGWLAVPLLEPTRQVAFSNYRYAYAEMLLMWEAWIPRLEILKFDTIRDDKSSDPIAPRDQFEDDGFHEAYNGNSNDNMSQHTMTRQGATSPIPLSKKEQLQSIIASGRGLDVVGICRIHEIHLDPLRAAYEGGTVGGAAGTCERCKRTQIYLICVFCRELIEAQYVTCLACGCAMHQNCLAEWHTWGETTCPAGDECNCVEEASSGQVESWAVMMGALRRNRERQNTEDSNGSITTKASDKTALDPTIRRPSLPFMGDSSTKVTAATYEGQQPASAAKISLGSKLKKSAGQWGSTATLRKKTGNAGMARR